MTKQCKTCKGNWNVSILKRVPKEGYECPHCESKRKRAEKLALLMAR